MNRPVDDYDPGSPYAPQTAQAVQAPVRAAWERQPSESDDEWTLFCAFLGSNATTLASFATGGNSAGWSTGTIYAYAARRRWLARRAAYRAHLAAIEAEAAEASAQAMGAAHAALASSLADIAAEALTLLRTDPEALRRMSARDRLEYARRAIELGRLIAGDSTSRVTVDHKGIQALTPEERDDLAAIWDRVEREGARESERGPEA